MMSRRLVEAPAAGEPPVITRFSRKWLLRWPHDITIGKVEMHRGMYILTSDKRNVNDATLAAVVPSFQTLSMEERARLTAFFMPFIDLCYELVVHAVLIEYDADRAKVMAQVTKADLPRAAHKAIMEACASAVAASAAAPRERSSGGDVDAQPARTLARTGAERQRLQVARQEIQRSCDTAMQQARRGGRAARADRRASVVAAVGRQKGKQAAKAAVDLVLDQHENEEGWSSGSEETGSPPPPAARAPKRRRRGAAGVDGTDA
ncbi:hypothetical protein HT031_003500 [Scenedesmus sp. PABB004]|nr:hypothetical protein HT031_003500 [Scenedesmus sp. PABB004]